ncbi:MAG: PIG-L deacetylase family protein [Candidatus Omnitrophota bacterium]|nr:PIG-L deacetylase family protein [Candidatus Omnitrophota bacterium]
MAEQILIVAAHPDDEVIGCGGAIAWHSARGDYVRMIIMADGVTSRSYNPDIPVPRAEELLVYQQAIERRKTECRDAASLLGVKKNAVYFLDLADQRLDTYPFLDLVKHIEKVKGIFSPTLVYTHFFGDLNLDHRLTAQAVLTAFRPRLGTTAAVKLFEVYETTRISNQAGYGDFVPDYLLDISPFWELKQKALSVYVSESCKYPHFRSVQALRERAAFWGERSGVKYGEAFLTRYAASEEIAYGKR